MSMEIKDKGFTGAGKEISQQLLKLNKEVLTKGSIIIQSAAVQYSPYKSGILRSSITRKVYKYHAIVGTNLVYAAIHEYGGIIRPKRGTHLVFQIDGRFVRAKQVEIPPHPYMRPAFDNNERKIYKMYKDGLKKIK